MPEKDVVEAIVSNLVGMGFKVATEVANIYRSADIAAVDRNGKVWVIECKISSMGQAVRQTKIHKLGADKVFIGTPYRNTKQVTLDMIKEAGVGLIYVMPDGSIHEAIEPCQKEKAWPSAKEKLRQRIIQVTK